MITYRSPRKTLPVYCVESQLVRLAEAAQSSSACGGWPDCDMEASVLYLVV